ncbi:hypothetical protein BGX20_000578 [Mortierella sp. AD010]|nr:hypothetical protein BGX20_000578 [Mortierella sp. AD010]
MRSHDPLLYPISAPIPVPGTQQEPTVPPVLALSSIGGTRIRNASGSSHDHEGHSNNRDSSNRLNALGVVGQNSSYLANTFLVGPPRHRSHYSGNSNNKNNLNTNPDNGSHTISHNKVRNNVNHNNTNNINSGLRFPSLIGGAGKKLTAENTALRAKITELERYLTGLKEELLLARAQIRVKNDEAKLSQNRKAVEMHELAQHIQRYETDLLAKSAECEALQNKLQYQAKELLDYKRVSSLSSSGGINSVALRINRNSSYLSESARSSTVFPASGNAGAFSSEEALIQIRQLKDENARKDEQLEELMRMVEKLKANSSQLEKQQSTTCNSVPTSNSGTSFDTAMVARSSSIGLSSVNSVGYDASAEHPKLLVRYQALRMQHAQASEYLEALESENNELRVKLLEISSNSSFTQAIRSPPDNSSDSTDSLQPMAAIAPTNSTNSLHHPKASTLTPLDLDNLSADTFWTPASTVTPSPTSAITSSGSPSMAVAPVLTRKSSLRYSRDSLLLLTLPSS